MRCFPAGNNPIVGFYSVCISFVDLKISNLGASVQYTPRLSSIELLVALLLGFHCARGVVISSWRLAAQRRHAAHQSKEYEILYACNRISRCCGFSKDCAWLTSGACATQIYNRGYASIKAHVATHISAISTKFLITALLVREV